MNTPLPEGWTITPKGFIHYKKDEYCKYVRDSSGRLDRNSIAQTLENYGYPDHARRWFLSPVEIAAPELLEALKMAVRYLEHPDVLAVTNQMALQGQVVVDRTRAAITAAEGGK